MIRKRFKLATVSLLFVLFFQCQQKPAFERAETIFKTTCASCHGEQMQAFVDRKWKFGNSEAELINTISKGNLEVGMPSFEAAFTPEEITELAQYIQEGIKNVDKYKFEEVPLTSDTFKTKNFSYHLDTVLVADESLWGMAFLPNGEILVTSKEGKLYRIDQDRNATNVAGLPEVRYEGQGGLMDIEIHPDYSRNQWVYISYSAKKTVDSVLLSTTAVDRARLLGDSLVERTRIFEALPYSKTKHHYGSRLEFDNDDLLYISVGDRGNRDENPQSLANHCGKIHRVKDDGSIPSDNPFINDTSAIASIYSYGHRNPQGMAKHPVTGKIWTHEHGPRGGDEINIIEKGVNYGWPVISYGLNYDGTIFTTELQRAGMKQPIHYWVPSIAPCGMSFITTDKYPGWEGQLLAGSLRFKYLNLCILDGEKIAEERQLMQNVARVREAKVGPDGYIYVAVERTGMLFRLVPIPN